MVEVLVHVVAGRMTRNGSAAAHRGWRLRTRLALAGGGVMLALAVLLTAGFSQALRLALQRLSTDRPPALPALLAPDAALAVLRDVERSAIWLGLAAAVAAAGIFWLLLRLLMGGLSRLHRQVPQGRDAAPGESEGGKPIFEAGGRFIGYRGVASDETAIVEAERRAAEARALLASALESTSETLLLLDADDRLVLWNHRFQEEADRIFPGLLQVGLPFEQLVRESARRGRYAVAGGDLEAVIADRLAQHRHPPSVHQCQLGDRRWVQVSTRRTADGGLVVVETDITELKRRDTQLRLLSAAVEQSASMIVVTSPDGTIEYANRKFAEVTGYPAEEAVGQSHAMLCSGATPREAYRDLWAALSAGREWSGEIQNKRSNGELYWCSEVISPMRDEHGAITHFVAVQHEVTERRRAAEQLLRAKQHAELANRAKSEFLANMSHELRTPLNAIIGFSEMIRGELFGAMGNARYRGYVEDIHRSGVHLLGVIDDILALSMAEAGELGLQDTAIELTALAAAAMRLVSARAKQRGLALSSGLAPGLPRLRADERSTKQVLLKLLSNAVKFTPAGGSVHLTAEREGDGGLTLAVSDSGIGIADRHLLQVFEPFFQVESSQARKHHGTGLGLSLSKALVEAHGGRLEIASQVGCGTTVRVRFPAERTLALDDRQQQIG